MYSTPVERFWEHLKIEAAKWAAAERPLPSEQESHQVVLRQAGGLTFPPEIKQYYANEFRRMVEHKRNRLSD